jgi:hypothetical protein
MRMLLDKMGVLSDRIKNFVHSFYVNQRRVCGPPIKFDAIWFKQVLINIENNINSNA